MLNICTKFRENISVLQGYKTDIKNIKGHNSLKNVGRVTFLFCAIHLIILYIQFIPSFMKLPFTVPYTIFKLVSDFVWRGPNNKKQANTTSPTVNSCN